MLGRVLVIAGKDPTADFGGSQTFVRALGRAARKAGYDPHIFCASRRAATERHDFGTLHQVWSPIRPFRALMVGLHQPFLVAAVDKFVGRDAGPHLVHATGGWSGVAVAVAKRLRRRGRTAIVLTSPFSTYSHETRAKVLAMGPHYSLAVRAQLRFEMLWVRLVVSPSEERGFRGSELVLPNYDSVRRIIEDEFGSGIRFAKMTYASEAAFIEDGLEKPRMPDFLQSFEPKATPLIVCVPRHDARKGIYVLLSALGELTARGIPFRACLAGGGQLLEQHRRLAIKLGLAGSTLIVGKVPDSYSLLRHADIFVLPSLEESSGSVSLLEAMQAGAAPVVSRIDGLPEDVTDEESALLITPGDVGELADALARCLGDPALRNRLAASAQATYRERFSADAYAKDLKSIYERFNFPPARESSKVRS